MYQNGSLADAICTERAEPCPPSKHVGKLTKGEAEAYDAVQAYLAANPDATARVAMEAMNVNPSTYSRAKKKSMEQPRKSLHASESGFIRPDDAIVANCPKGPIGHNEQVFIPLIAGSGSIDLLVDEPELDTADGVSDRQTLENVIDALDGFDTKTKRRILCAAGSFHGITLIKAGP